MNKLVLMLGLILLSSLALVNAVTTDISCLIDSEVLVTRGDSNYGTSNDIDIKGNDTSYGYFMFDLTDIPANVTISTAELCLYRNTSAVGGVETFRLHYLYDVLNSSVDGTPLTETSITWNNQPCGTGFSNTTHCNLTFISSISSGDMDYYCWNAYPTLDEYYNDSKSNMSFIILGNAPGGNIGRFYTKEHGSLNPVFNVTYTFIFFPTPFFALNLTPATYDNTTTSIFNLTWSQPQYGIDAALIEINHTGTLTNYTMNNYDSNKFNYSNKLGAGSFTWKSYANSTQGAWNNTPAYSFTISQASSACNITVDTPSAQYNNTNVSVQTDQTINTTATCTIGTTLYYDGSAVSNPHSTTHGAGTHTYITNTSGNTNYSSNQGQTIIITSTLPPSSTGTPGGGGGGGGDDGKNDCDIIVSPININVTDQQKLVEIKVENNENFTYTPSLGFEDVPDQPQLSPQLAIASSLGTVGSGETKSFGVQYIGTFVGSVTTSGTSSLKLIDSNCDDITLFVTVSITNSTSPLSELFNTNSNEPFFRRLGAVLELPLINSVPGFKVWMVLGLTSIAMGSLIIRQKKWYSNEYVDIGLKTGGVIVSSSLITAVIGVLLNALVGGGYV